MEATNWICTSRLVRWSEREDQTSFELDSLEDEERFFAEHQQATHSSVVFGTDLVINSKVALWRGDPLRLDVDALVHATNERFERCTRFGDHLYEQSGPQLRKCLFNRVKHCRVGSVKITKGYSILPRYIIHTASPQYKRKFRSAAENALFHCYYNILLAAKKYGLRTLALGSLTIPRHNFPEEEATHLGLRVVRRFLERFPDSFDLIVFVLGNKHHYRLYESLMRLYFPRNPCEQFVQCFSLPSSVGGSMGEPIRPERDIRIKENPIEALQSSSEWGDSSSSSYENSSEEEKSDSSSDGSSSSSSLVLSIGRSKFARMQECRDKKYCQTKVTEVEVERDRSESLVSVGRQLAKSDSVAHYRAVASLNQAASSTRDELLIREYQRQLKCERLQRKVKLMSEQEKKSQLINLQQAIYISGVDSAGRPVLTLVGSRFQSDSMCTHFTLNYVIELLRQISPQEYVIVYFHTEVTEANLPKPTFLSELNDLLSYQDRKRLHAVYIVHPSVWSRLYFWWLKSFQFKALKDKITFVSKMTQLKRVMSSQWLIRVPSFVQQFD